MNASSESAVLRFSNQDGEVIPMHQELIREHGFVWWGWWKKEFEEINFSVLRDLRKITARGAVSVALLNRKDEEFFSARVEEVRYADDGTPMLCPGEESPESYRDLPEGLAAWFKITAIFEIDEHEFEQNFGSIPSGEPTMYGVRTIKGRKSYYPQPSWDLKITQTAGSNILHLSDLHFGEFHAFRSSSEVPGTSLSKPALLERVLEVVSRLDDNIGLVIVSGDLVTKASTDNFDLVEDFLNELARELRITPDHIICVPGNHDFKVISDGEMPTVNYGHERIYRNFLRRFYRASEAEIERFSRFAFPNGREVVVVSLNSARLRGQQSKEYGYVGRHRYDEMLDYLQRHQGSSNGQPISRLAVLHHHVLPVRELESPRDGSAVSLTVDAAEIFGQLQARKFDGILHGHQHVPFFMRGSRHTLDTNEFLGESEGDLAVIGCGATGASTLNPEFNWNALGVYQVQDSALVGEFWRYTPERAPEPFSKFRIPWKDHE